MLPMMFGRSYMSCTPQPDSEPLAANKDRLLLKQRAGDEPFFELAPKGDLTSGWVIGIFEETT